MNPSVDIIVLNWNGKADTLICLDSLSRLVYDRYRVIVVDNGSIDDSVATIRAVFPGLPLVETGRNLGYAGGNNAGLRYALEHDPADYIFILNNDTEASPSLLARLVAAAGRYPAVGVFGPKIYFKDRPSILWFAGARWDRTTHSFRHIGINEPDAARFDAPIEVDYITGCALFMRRSVVEKVGLLDERFFLVYEEVDWCYRARGEGFASMTVPDALLWHRVSASFGGSSSPLEHYFLSRNRLLWAERHLPVLERRGSTSKSWRAPVSPAAVARTVERFAVEAHLLAVSFDGLAGIRLVLSRVQPCAPTWRGRLSHPSLRRLSSCDTRQAALMRRPHA